MALLGTQGKNTSNGGFSAPPQQTIFQSSKVSPIISERPPTPKEQESLNAAAFATSLSNWVIGTYYKPSERLTDPNAVKGSNQIYFETNRQNKINDYVNSYLDFSKQFYPQKSVNQAGATLDTDFSKITTTKEGKPIGKVDLAANPFHEFLSGAGNYAKSAAVTFAAQAESLPFAYGKQFELIGSGFKKPLEQAGQFPLTPEASKFESTYAKPTYVGSLLGGAPTGRDIFYNAGSAAAEIGSLAIGLRGFVPIRTSNIAIDVLKAEKVAPALEEGTLAATKQAVPIQKVSVYKGLTFGYEEGGKPLVGRGYKGDLIFGNPKPEQTIPTDITPTKLGIEISSGSNLSNKIFNSPEALGYMQQRNIISPEDVKVSQSLQTLHGLSEKAPIKVYGGFGEKPMKDIQAGPETQFVQSSIKGLQSRGGLKIETGETFKAGPLHGSYADRPFYPQKYSELSGDIDVTIKEQSARNRLAENLAGGLNKISGSSNRVFTTKKADVMVEDFLTGRKSKVINLPSSKEEEGSGILVTKGTKVYGKSLSTDIFKIEGQKVNSPKYNFARRVAVTGTLQGKYSEAPIFGLGKGTEGGKYLGPPAYRLKDVGRIYKGGLHLSEIYTGLGKTKESSQALESIGILRSRFGTETLGKAGFDFNAYLTGLGKNETPVFGITSKTEPLGSSGIISKSTSNVLLSSKISGSSLGSISSKKSSSNVNRQLISSKGASYGKSKSSSYSTALLGKSFGPSYASKGKSSSSLIGPSGISSKYAESNITDVSGLSVGPSKGPSGISFTGSSSLTGPSTGPSGLITSSSTGKPSSSLITPPSGSSSSTFIPTSTSLINPPSKAGKLLDFGGPAKKKRKYKIKEGYTQIKGLRINNVFSNNLNIKAGLNY